MKNSSSHLKSKTLLHNEKLGVANWLTILRLVFMLPFLAIMIAMFVLIYYAAEPSFFWYNKLEVNGYGKKEVLSILYWINVSLFILAMFTDWIDGYYARKTKTISVFGKIFDPIADKVATSLMLVFLIMMNYSFLVVIILFIIRDVIVDGARMYAVKKNIKVQANFLGKAKTFLMSFSIILIAIAMPWVSYFNRKSNNVNLMYVFYINIPLIISLVLAWVSGFMYLKKYLKGIRYDHYNNTDENEYLSDFIVEKTKEVEIPGIKIDKNLVKKPTSKPKKASKTDSQDEADADANEKQIDFSKTEIFE
ncbi:CDP-diacylglycerol--glycerol-3-phosphate 3-phosphatidyltransferase [Metamycoplasma hyosynoviae]|uniref:CDP-diacylglycerol--glycerol-3-phosphate 3-phosphatidyltransferase n=1 Tax=Metamycoplasma hyosynoviae TaxID=29559 RepID=UPI002359B0E8|nr:CDP-diacylglycerol--glycerol-3-phosphate 3-phosphatidyltransferase [Metamycoplasma hyosynoviae]MDC8920125.1 CDP-diacylglycerol--glycerol-3-phosphate 3-phosphatidyltransferase [Metamycoplasma hyosynoviae]MDD7894797.1 CDP-diacylglycerol--glycerol-3-phosphate 3-phosphatidyltransferase [Metamycoplasma hyosynoviae]MDD7895234.1 CDP-diacylglycerol--glycerol-3-phosphate 3-phosphatidyltransferase [Metamycoplasma hyosynoviae]MDD7898146.1 CDP-diacylglycerol--glycerol-3-phosphate 3-phosphatidyltransfera